MVTSELPTAAIFGLKVKKTQHRAEGETFLLTFPFTGPLPNFVCCGAPSGGYRRFINNNEPV